MRAERTAPTALSDSHFEPALTDLGRPGSTPWRNLNVEAGYVPFPTSMEPRNATTCRSTPPVIALFRKIAGLAQKLVKNANGSIQKNATLGVYFDL
jgi:hypothetical protein